ncbi:MAG: hypothetical protein A2452_11660 [Candidatus Firestonebacteria bacterium RIFOXYC2_FULL_39_67]|nr:MAG: hypothetical protein A2536_07650 [Candidatus Firestonebacteria bacterium RIFOXYD2_FULL_39_29]OGF53879.1 MAG: hypothetical protein A2452_11660 [Candidatus Firestonebacteria bacterium RIFOXYC2_FULL_39_67]
MKINNRFFVFFLCFLSIYLNFKVFAVTGSISPEDLDEIYGWPSVSVPTTKAPKLDGILDDDCWKKSRPITTRMMVFPDYPELKENKTFIRLVSDKENLYIGFECNDSNMEKVGENDTVEMFLDPERTEDYKYF